jgi:hypothetical protein
MLARTSPSRPNIGGNRAHITWLFKDWLVELAVLLLLALVGVTAFLLWLSIDNSERSAFPPSLEWLPPPRPMLPAGYLGLTASKLNIKQPGMAYLGFRVRYVDARTPSTGPSVVSVRPLTPTMWAAVALGANGLCYGILGTDSAKGYGDTWYARFSKGTVCRGYAASRSTVREGRQPFD